MITLLAIIGSQCVATSHLDPQNAASFVREEFIYSYKAYQQYAWGCDELYPMNKSCRNYHQYSLLWAPIAAIDTIHLICNSNFTLHHDQFTDIRRIIKRLLFYTKSLFKGISNGCW